VRRTGDRVDLEVRVTDARTARPVWSKAYESEVVGLVGVLERVSRGVAAAVLLETAGPGPAAPPR